MLPSDAQPLRSALIHGGRASEPLPELPPAVAEALADLKGRQAHLDADVAVLVDHFRRHGGAQALHDFFLNHVL